MMEYNIIRKSPEKSSNKTLEVLWTKKYQIVRGECDSRDLDINDLILDDIIIFETNSKYKLKMYLDLNNLKINKDQRFKID